MNEGIEVNRIFNNWAFLSDIFFPNYIVRYVGSAKSLFDLFIYF
jgi:hypothetical protein